MTKVYRIAEYLTSEQKRRAINSVYDQSATSQHNGLNPCPIDKDGYCPLGRATLHPSYRPASNEVAQIILPPPWGKHYSNKYDDRLVNHWRADADPIRLAAKEFIDDWDGGKITDLAAALGVE